MEDLLAHRLEFTEMLAITPSAIRTGVVSIRAVLEVQEMPRCKPLLHEVEVIKMDVGDRKNARYFKEKERQEIAEPLAALISQVKLRQFTEESSMAPLDAGSSKPNETASLAGHPEVIGCASSAGIEQVGEGYATAGTMRRRGAGGNGAARKRYSDAEISLILKTKMY
jgi:hypothetical protein